MDDVWAVMPGRGGTVQLTLRVGPPRPLVGVLTDTELASVASGRFGFAAGHSGLWLRSAGWLVAAVGFGGLVEHAWRRRR